MILYDQKSPIKWYYKGTLTPSQMKKMPKFKLLFKEECVLYGSNESGFFSFKPLSELKAKYGVEIDDPEEAMTMLEEVIREFKVPVNVRDLKDNLELTEDAILEVGDLLFENSEYIDMVSEAALEAASMSAENQAQIEANKADLELTQESVLELSNLIAEVLNF